MLLYPLKNYFSISSISCEILFKYIEASTYVSLIKRHITLLSHLGYQVCLQSNCIIYADLFSHQYPLCTNQLEPSTFSAPRPLEGEWGILIDVRNQSFLLVQQSLCADVSWFWGVAEFFMARISPFSAHSK